VSRSREQLGLTVEQSKTPIHVGNEVWTLLEAAQYLHNQRREADPDTKQALELSAELARLRRESRKVEDRSLFAAADALEKSARSIWAEA